MAEVYNRTVWHLTGTLTAWAVSLTSSYHLRCLLDTLISPKSPRQLFSTGAVEFSRTIEDACECDLKTCSSCRALPAFLSLNTDLNIPTVLEMPFGHRGEGDDAKKRHLSLLTADKQTSDGALCSASRAWSAEQLSVKRRTKQGESHVNKVWTDKRPKSMKKYQRQPGKPLHKHIFVAVEAF